MPLQDEERLFIETMRELNRQAAKMQAGETYKNEKGQSLALLPFSPLALG